MNRSLKPLPRVPAAGLFRKSPVLVLQKEIWICLLFPANYVLGAFSLIIFFLFLKICFWLCWVFIAVFGLSLVAVIGVTIQLRSEAFSLWWFLLLWNTGSMCMGFSSCGSWAPEHGLFN